MSRAKIMPDPDQSSSDQLIATWVELVIRLGVLGILLYWSFLILQPFITIAIWSVVLTVALYPVYDWIVVMFGGRRRLAAAVLTVLSLLVVIGPATWLVLGLIDSLRMVSEHLDLSALALPPPPETVRDWPLIGEPLYQFWELASTKLAAAFAKIAPHLKPLGSTLLHIGAGAGTGAIKFFVAIVVAGFLFPPAPCWWMPSECFRIGRFGARRRIRPTRRAARSGPCRGASSAFRPCRRSSPDWDFLVAGIPGASLITSAVLILGIIQIGPSIVLVPLIIWSWWTMETTTALLFTAYMIPVNLLDNIFSGHS